MESGKDEGKTKNAIKKVGERQMKNQNRCVCLQLWDSVRVPGCKSHRVWLSFAWFSALQLDRSCLISFDRFDLIEEMSTSDEHMEGQAV